MSAFTVSAAMDKGYQAGNAVAATRIDTPIKDLPFAVSAFTGQFISDIGARELSDVLTCLRSTPARRVPRAPRIEASPTLVAAWAQPRDTRSWTLRLHEVSGQSGHTTLRLAPGWSAQRCGLNGRLPRSGHATPSIEHRPYEIVSVLPRRLQGDLSKLWPLVCSISR